MSEKKGGFRIVAWLVAFMLILGVGWFGLSKFSLIKKQEKMSKGEAIVVTLVAGEVSVKKMGAADWREVAVEDTLEMGDAIKTGNDSYCELQMVKRGIFRVENSSELYLATLVKEKQNATATIGLGLTEKSSIIKALKDGDTTLGFLQEYSKRLADNTDFKNVWFQLVSADGHSVDRSWTSFKKDKIADSREDITRVLKTKQIINSISVGIYDITFKSIIPVFDTDGSKRFLGAIEVITHFNSIAERLKDRDIEPIILADKIYKKQLTKAMTNLFIGEYYVANKNFAGIRHQRT